MGQLFFGRILPPMFYIYGNIGYTVQKSNKISKGKATTPTKIIWWYSYNIINNIKSDNFLTIFRRFSVSKKLSKQFINGYIGFVNAQCYYILQATSHIDKIRKAKKEWRY